MAIVWLQGIEGTTDGDVHGTHGGGGCAAAPYGDFLRSVHIDIIEGVIANTASLIDGSSCWL